MRLRLTCTLLLLDAADWEPAEHGFSHDFAVDADGLRAHIDKGRPILDAGDVPDSAHNKSADKVDVISRLQPSHTGLFLKYDATALPF